MYNIISSFNEQISCENKNRASMEKYSTKTTIINPYDVTMQCICTIIAYSLKTLQQNKNCKLHGMKQLMDKISDFKQTRQ